MIVPDGHNENHTSVHGFSHLFKTTLNLEVIWIIHNSLEGIAHTIGDGVVLGIKSWNVGFWVLDDFTVLNEDSSDFTKVSGIGTVSSDELGNNLKWLGGINSLAWTIEVFDTSSVWVKIATIFIADTFVSVGTLTAFKSFAGELSINSTRMSSESFSHVVGLPDIHLGAARSVLSSSGIWVGLGWVPANGVSLSIDEFNILWALGITISSSVSGTGVIVSVFIFTSIFLHLDEVKSSINTAWHVGDINCESELFVLKFEHFVFIESVHHEGS